MHLYLRLLCQARDDEQGSPAELTRLRTKLASSAAVAQVKTVRAHPKGGYAVTVDTSDDKLGCLFEYLAERGLRPVW